MVVALPSGKDGHGSTGVMLRRCASTPALLCGAVSDGGLEAGLDVYVMCRPFSEFGGPLWNGLPAGAKGTLTQLGVCHFITAFRTPDGSLHAFDFGPLGGDIALDLPSAPAAGFAWLRPGLWLGGAQRGGEEAAPVRAPRGTAGEIREEVLTELPPESLYVGRTALTLREIRDYNGVQDDCYRLNDNDCRHYVNNLVAYATGTAAASSSMTRHSLTLARGDAPLSWGDHLLRLATNLTDVRHWPAVQAAGHATLAAAALLTGHAGLSRVAPAQPWVAKPAGSAAAAAMANMAACMSEAPVVRHTVRLGARLGGGLASVASFMRLGAATGSSTATATLSVLSSAGTASRGAAAVYGRGRIIGSDALRLAGRIAPLGLSSFRLPGARRATLSKPPSPAQPQPCEVALSQ